MASRWMSCEGGKQPGCVGFAGSGCFEGEEFWSVVWVEFADGAFEGLEMSAAGFDDDEEFFGALDGALPVVERLDGPEDVDAGGEFAF